MQTDVSLQPFYTLWFSLRSTGATGCRTLVPTVWHPSVVVSQQYHSPPCLCPSVLHRTGDSALAPPCCEDALSIWQRSETPAAGNPLSLDHYLARSPDGSLWSGLAPEPKGEWSRSDLETEDDGMENKNLRLRCHNSFSLLSGSSSERSASSATGFKSHWIAVWRHSLMNGVIKHPRKIMSFVKKYIISGDITIWSMYCLSVTVSNNTVLSLCYCCVTDFV